MKTFLFFLAISIKLIINSEALLKSDRIEDKITCIIGEHAERSYDFVKGLQALNLTNNQHDLTNYTNENNKALLTLIQNYKDRVFIPMWGSCSLVAQIYKNYNKTFSKSAVDHTQFIKELAKRFNYFGKMINVTSYNILIADKELKEERKVITNLFDKFISNLQKNFNQSKQAAEDELSNLRAEITSLEKEIMKTHLKMVFFLWPFAINKAEAKKLSLEEEARVLDKFLNIQKTYPNWTQEVKKDLSRISEDLAQNIQNTMDKLEGWQKWMVETNNLSKEVKLSEESKNQILKQLDKAINDAVEATCWA